MHSIFFLLQFTYTLIILHCYSTLAFYMSLSQICEAGFRNQRSYLIYFLSSESGNGLGTLFGINECYKMNELLTCTRKGDGMIQDTLNMHFTQVENNEPDY